MSRLVRYKQSDLKSVRRFFNEVGLNDQDVFYDLGCGEGWVLLIAALEFGVRKAVGVEIRRELVSPLLYEYDNVEIRLEDLHCSDFSDATFIYMYLSTEYVWRLQEKLLNLDKCTVVSNDFPLIEVSPDQVYKINRSTYYVYYIGGEDE